MTLEKSSIKPELSIKQLGLDPNLKTKRKKWRWTKTNAARANDIVRIFSDMRQWWPLTERQLFYRLISNQCINQPHWCKFGKPERGPVKDIYGTVGQQLKWLRIQEKVPWGAVSDETRTLTEKVGFASARNFVEQEVSNLFRGYSRCVAADQPNHVEIWIEKQALLNIIEPIADKYCRRVMCCKGYNSISFQADFYDRATKAMNKGYRPVVLYFGDWDPSGVSMIHSAIQTLEDELDLYGVDYYRCGINPEHFSMIQADPVPIKTTDSRAKNFIKDHGTTCYELDAFHPLELQDLVERSIQKFTDIEAVSGNAVVEIQEKDILSELKTDVAKYISDKFDEMGGNALEQVRSPKPNAGGGSDFSTLGEMLDCLDFESFVGLASDLKD